MARWALSALLAGCLFAATGTARAQLSTDAIYEDARDVINGVIEREAVRSIARQITCHSAEGLLLHYPRSLDNLYEERFDALGESFRTESARVMGAYAFSTVAYSNVPTLDVLFPFAWDEQCIGEITDSKALPSQYLRKANPIVPAYLKAYDDCDLALGSLSPRRTLACELGLAVEASVADRREEAHRRLVSLATLPLALYVTTEQAGVTYGGVPGTDYHSIWSLLKQEVLQRTAADRAPLSWLTLEQTIAPEALELPTSGNLSGKPGAWIRSLLERADWSTGQQQLVTAAALLVNPTALKVHVTGQPRETEDLDWASLVTALSHASSPDELAESIVERAGKVPSDLIIIVQSLSPLGALQIDTAPKGGDAAAVTGAGLADLGRLLQVAKLSDKLRILPFTSGGASTSPESKRRLARLLNAAREVGTLSAIWKEAERRKFAASTTLQALERSVRVAENLLRCEQATPPGACELVTLPFRKSAESVLSRALRASDEDSGVNAALASIDDLFEIAKAQPAMQHHAEGLGRLQAITNTLLAHVTGTGGSRGGQEAAREAFKAAAYDWLLESGDGEGYLTGPIDWVNVSSGVSWSNGYVNPGGGSARYQVSAEVIPFRFAPVRKRNVYIALGGSVLNLIGPFSELALRDSNQVYEDSNRVWLDFLEPRIDLSLGVPSFSRRLLLYAGVSWRPVAAFRTKAGADATVVYDNVFDDDDEDLLPNEDPSERRLRHLSFGLGVRFVPH